MIPLWVPLVVAFVGLLGVLATQLLANKRARDDRADAGARDSRNLESEAQQRLTDWQRDQRRAAYVEFQLSLDAMHQALVDVVDAHGRYLGLTQLLDGSRERSEIVEQARAREISLGAPLDAAFSGLRRSYHTLSLFAPPEVMEPANDMFIPLMKKQHDAHYALTVAPVELEAPEWDQDASGRYTNACRATLGTGAIEIHLDDV